jgi:transcriptional regulator with XRE-family HTH domain
MSKDNPTLTTPNARTDLGKKIRETRKEARLSQRDLGKRLAWAMGRHLHFSQAAISDMERGVAPVSDETAKKLAEILGKPLAYFLGNGLDHEQLSTKRYTFQQWKRAVGLPSDFPKLHSLNDEELDPAQKLYTGDDLNRVVKDRELYRPYGATVLLEETDRLVGRLVTSPFMMVALPLSMDWQKRIPAVCHVDGTCRIQTVSEHDSTWFRDILKAFYALTGIPAVLNTSFNVAGKPIVETPEDALVAFINMRIDALAIEEWYLEKPVCLARSGQIKPHEILKRKGSMKR